MPLADMDALAAASRWAQLGSPHYDVDHFLQVLLEGVTGDWFRLICVFLTMVSFDDPHLLPAANALGHLQKPYLVPY